MWPDDLYIVIKVMRLHLILHKRCSRVQRVKGRRQLPWVLASMLFLFFFSYACVLSLNGRRQVSKYTVAPLHVLFLFPCMFYLNVALGRCRRHWARVGHNCEAKDNAGLFKKTEPISWRFTSVSQEFAKFWMAATGGRCCHVCPAAFSFILLEAMWR